MEIAIAAGTALKAVGTIVGGIAAKAAAGHLGAMAIVAGANVAVGVGASALTAMMTPKVGQAASPDIWSPDTDAPNPVAMGRVGGVAGFIAHRAAYGPTNRYQSLVTTVSLGPIRGNWIAKFDDEVTNFGANDVATDGAHAGELWCQFRLGAQPETAHTSPTGLDDGASLPDWSSDHKLSGKATFLATFKENSKYSEYQGGLPKPSLEFDGGYVWDPRDDDTYPGGSGSCRLDDPSTWVWSEDPCIWALNWAIGRWAGDNGSGEFGVPYECTLMAGIGATLDGIDVAALVNAANVSEANGWTLSAWPTSKDDKHEVYRALLQAGGALPARNAGRISCITRGEVQSSVVTITAADTAGPVELSLGQSRLERINTIHPRFWSRDHDWQMIQIDPVSDPDFVTADGGIARARGVDYPYVPAKDQAAQLAYYDIADNRERFSGTVPMMPHMRRLQPGDCFTFNEPGFLLDGVKAKCLRRSIDPVTLQVTVTWRQETDWKHTAAAGETGTTSPGTDPTSPPSEVVAPPTGASISVDGDEVTIEWTNGDARFFRTLIFQSATSSFADATQVASKGGAPEAAQTAVLKPGPGEWWFWLQTRSGGIGADDVSDEVALGSVTVGGPAAATIPGLGDLAEKNTVDTPDIEPGAVTDHASAVTTGTLPWSGSGYDVAQTVTLTTTGGRVEIQGSMTLSGSASSQFNAFAQVERDGVVLWGPFTVAEAWPTTSFTSYNMAIPFFIALDDEPAAGPHTWDLKFSFGSTGGARNVRARSLSVREMKTEV
jgi:hypothetical protein